MLSEPLIVAEAFWLGVSLALVFVILVGLDQSKHLAAKLIHKKRNKIKHRFH
jgi:hypothetical protein